jgi:hypothetical protein
MLSGLSARSSEVKTSEKEEAVGIRVGTRYWSTALPANQMQSIKLPNKSIKYLEILFQTNKSKILDLK